MTEAIEVTGTLLDAEGVAAMLGVRREWVYKRSREWLETNGRRGIPTVRLGRYRRYRREAILAWIEQVERGEAEP
jgi:predicted DNA-binding transcriptional regulator AlpA